MKTKIGESKEITKGGVSCFQDRSGSMLPPIQYKYRCMSTIKPRVGASRWGVFPGRSPERPSGSREESPELACHSHNGSLCSR